MAVLRWRRFAAACVSAGALSFACGGGGGGGAGGLPLEQGDYRVLAWNDLGMHCLNPTYDELVILPPYNTVWAQVVRRGDPPQVVTSGVTVEYRLVGNTRSYGKGSFGQFWDGVKALFGVDLARDHGLNLVDHLSNGLAGAMVAKGDHFQVDGIPVVPIDDAGTWNPYQVAEISVKDLGGKVLVTARTTVPTSDEIDCRRCHGASAFADILATHDRLQGTDLAGAKPVLCASCHASPALGAAGRIGGRTFLSEAIHAFHARLPPDERPACYDCHPGQRTACSRSRAHTANDGNCTHCHGSLSEVGYSIARNARVPWVDEPSCATQCHAGVPGVATGAALYRRATGHGGIYCAGCHGSPHAMIPSRVASDQAQAVAYQGAPLPLGDCNACHETSRGEGLDEYDEHHAGASPEARNACTVCHTVVPGAARVADWPHAFGWKARSIAR